MATSFTLTEVTSTDLTSTEVTLAETMLIGAILWPFTRCGFLADDRARTWRSLRAGALRVEVPRLGLADRFFVAECLFITKL
jgi:hypothetical protein